MKLNEVKLRLTDEEHALSKRIKDHYKFKTNTELYIALLKRAALSINTGR